MKLKASPESKICLSCGHWVSDMDEAIFLEMDESDGKSYGYHCQFCAKYLIEQGYARIVNTNSIQSDTKDG